jgi:wyosine [tRNA(Phe)-imidazoG37] synthetase (radical SAM superfamily)
VLRTERLFCSKPFKWFEVTGWYDPKGDVFMCCPGWLQTTIGNVQFQSVWDIWNGKKAQEIRQTILDGSFQYCSRQRCAFFQTVSGPVQRADEIKDEDLREAIEHEWTVLPYGPREINCSYDKSCNLSCPSCRSETIVETDKEREIAAIQKRLQEEALGGAHRLYITGSGDPFGSPFFRAWLQAMKKEDMPNIRNIHLHTNAQLWTRESWNKISEEIQAYVTSTEISVDAAKPETYRINRRGGSFHRLTENLEFISSLRKNGPLGSVTLSMVVQENNFVEMPDFVSLGRQFGFDTVYFSRLFNWGTFSEEEYQRRAVHLTGHPKHRLFIDLIREDLFKDSMVHLGNLTELLVE